jgi:geranylgeranyl diphosphate synthase type II
MNKEAFRLQIKEKARLIDSTLDKYLPPENMVPETLHKAMRYSVFAGGKRMRPVLCLAAAKAVGSATQALLAAACGLELIHTYSLIHDDLPAMDNDDYRRGKLTNHKVYGDAIAILAGDALLTLAFQLIAESGRDGSAPPQVVTQVLKEVAEAAGSLGMIGGQVIDIESENKMIDQDTLNYIHTHKTGALFKASVRSGALLGGATDSQLAQLTRYAECLGLAFQITDDILDVEGDSAKLGKTVGSDERKKKSTYPARYGLTESKQLARQSVDEAIAALQGFDERADILRYIAGYLLDRTK